MSDVDPNKNLYQAELIKVFIWYFDMVLFTLWCSIYCRMLWNWLKINHCGHDNKGTQSNSVAHWCFLGVRSTVDKDLSRFIYDQFNIGATLIGQKSKITR